MLVVVAVFAVLAAIFIIASRQFLIKTRVSRAKQELKTQANALTAYEAQYSVPPSNDEGLTVLRQTTLLPTELPIDPFLEQSGDHYTYYRFEGRGGGGSTSMTCLSTSETSEERKGSRPLNIWYSITPSA